MIIPRLLEHEMHMARPIRMSMQLFKQGANGTIMRNGIRHGNNSMEPEDAVPVTVHDRPSVRTVSVGILYIVEAPRIGLPDVDRGPSYWLPRGVFDRAEDQASFALGVVRDGAAIGRRFGFVCVERAKNSAFGRVWGFGVVYRVDEEREA